mgnify:FL=1
MTTINIATTLPTGTFHARQSGLWGQLRASVEIEAKLARVEPLFKELHGRGLNRTAFFTKCRELARETKGDVGGYLQYTTQAIAGIMLGEMHTRIGKEVRRNKKLKNEVLKRTNVVFELGDIVFDTAEFVKGASGMRCVNGFATQDSKTYKLYEALLKRNYPVSKVTLMKESGIDSVAHFYVTIQELRAKGFTIDMQRGTHRSIAPKYSLVA